MRAVTAAAKVLVVEDDEAIGRSLEGVLLERGYAVERCLRGGDACSPRTRSGPTSSCSISGSPTSTASRSAAACGAASPLLPIVMLTARGEEMDVVLGLSAGADDYVAKPFRLNELLARVAAQLRRSEGAAGAHVTVADVVIDASARTVRRGDAAIELRPREFDLLLLLAQNAGRVVTRDRILAELWRDHWGGASKTLDMHISTLRRRLGEPDLITTLRGVGYRIDVP